MSDSQSLPGILSSILSSGGDNSIVRSSLESILSGSTPNARVFRPYADIYNSEDTFAVYIDLPGVDKDDIKVDFFNNQLCISGERRRPTEDAPVSNECHHGNFSKRIALPHSVTNRNSVKVTLNRGVLIILVDKAAENANRFTVSVD